MVGPWRGLAGLVLADALLWLCWERIPHGQTELCFKRFVRIANAEVVMFLMGRWFVRPRLEELWGGWVEGLGRDALSALLVLLHWAVMVAYLGHYVFVQPEPLTAVVVCFVALGFFIQLSALLVAARLLEELNRRLLRRQPGLLGLLLSSRRLHTAVAIVLALAMTGTGLAATSRPPRLVPQPIRIAGLPAELEGFRIALVTDVHIGPTVGTSRVRRLVAEVNKAEADVVALVGDLVDGFVDGLRDSLEPLGSLRARDGVVFVTGNHEYYHSHVDEWLAEVGRRGVRPLRNEALRVARGPAELCLAGVDDLSAEKAHVPGHGLNASRALAPCSPASVKVLLSHQPNGVKRVLRDWAETEPRVDLFLAGHTHGGQLFVVAPVAWLLNSFFCGHYVVTTPYASQVFVSPGAHWGGPPIKIPGLSQVPVITLTKA